MNQGGGSILVINAGSSSIKADVFVESTLGVEYAIQITGIEQGTARISVSGHESVSQAVDSMTFDEALKRLFELLDDRLPTKPIAIGYRVVHGGEKLTRPTLIDDSVISELQKLDTVDPEHAPVARRVIEYCRQKYGSIPHVACFDTMFFAELPTVAKMLPLPRRYFDRGIRRYGFHGLSYTYLLDEFRRVCGGDASMGRLIIAHLGSGASLVAVHNGTPVDTTMAYSPASGVMMSTRAGDIDPGVYWSLLQEGLNAEETLQLLNKQSGLLGVSELSGDMYTLLESESQNENAHLAVEMFCSDVRKAIAGLSTTMGGCDSIIFSGGMGENAPRIRSRILRGLEFIGVELDEQRNEQSEECISSASSRIGVHVLHTDESLVIAREVTHMLQTDISTENKGE